MTTHIRVLYAEDSPQDADLTRWHFEREAPDFRLDIVVTGASCRERLAAESFDLLLLDNHLPDMDGVDVIARVRADRRTLPIVLVTGAGDDEVVGRALRAGAADYVPKAADYLETLPGILRGVLARERGRRQMDGDGAPRVRRILYVEPNPMDVELTASHFAAHAPHLHVQAVASGPEALARLSGGDPYDLVLTDLRVPGMDALEIVHTARQRGVDLPFIVITGRGDEATAVAILRLGASDYLIKRENYLVQLPHAIDHALHRFDLDRATRRLHSELASLNDSLERKVDERTADLRRAAAVLRTSEAGYRHLIETTHDLIQSVDSKWDFTFVNPAWCTALGWTAEEALRLNFRSVVHPDQLTHCQRLFAELPTKKEIRQVEVTFVAKDGREVALEGNLTGVFENGVFTGAQSFFRDITDRKESEAALRKGADHLRQSEQRLRDLIDGLGQSMFVGLLTPDGTLIEANRPALEAAGLTLDDVRGKPVDETYWWSYSPLVQRQLREAVARAAGGEPVRYDVEVRAAEGQYIVLDFSIEPLRDDTGKVVLLVPSAIVITERKQAELATQQANARLQALSHRLLDIQESERRSLARELHDEIGQALTAAKINMQSLQRYPETLSSRLDDSIALVERALQQVRSLSLELRPPMLDDLGLVPALRWLADQQSKRAGMRLSFDSRLPDGMVTKPVDIACFRIAQEALTNTVRHSEARQVTVDLCQDEGALHLRVRDDGKGFDFETARQRAARGSSLGLIGMEERATLAGGGIEWCSPAGGGTEVHAWFALAIATSEGDPPATS